MLRMDMCIACRSKNASLDSDVGLCSRVVLELVDGLEHTGPSLFSTSPWLFLKLYDNGVNAARKSRRYFPTQLDVRTKDVDSLRL